MPIFLPHTRAAYHTKPPVGVQLDRGHPLAQGLNTLLVLNEGVSGPVDLVRGGAGTLIGSASWVQSDFGPAVRTTGAKWDAAVAPQAINYTGIDGTFVGLFRITASTPEYSMAVGVREDGGANAGGLLMRKPSGYTLGWDYPGASNAWQFSTGPAIPVGPWVWGAVSVSTNLATLWVNGSTATDSGHGPSSAGTFSAKLNVGRDPYTASDRGLAGDVAFGAFWTRTLTIGEIEALAERPWGMLWVPGQRYWYAAAAEPPGEITMPRLRMLLGIGM